ncbi:MAG: DUF3106 domain-containing protein [Betaproteobacteria bacterium]
MARTLATLIAALLAALAGMAHAEREGNVPQRPWSSLSPDERRILGPVGQDWDRLPGYQQQRLISSARRYPSLQPIQKERFNERIRDWATMTPEQRRAARETYKGLSRLPPEKQHELRERWLQRHGDDVTRGQPPRRGERPGR